MKKLSYVFLSVYMCMGALLTGCSPAAPAAEAAPEASTSVPVEVVTAQEGLVEQVYSYSGNLESNDSVHLVSLVAGRVEKVHVAVGDELEAGEPIVVLENRTYSAQQQQAQANYQLTQLAMKKMQEGARDEQLAAAREAVQYLRAALDDVENNTADERTTAAAGMAAAEASLRLAQANYDKVAWAGQVGMTEEALKLEQATIGYEAAQAAYNLTTNPPDSKTAPLRIQLAQAEATLALAEEPFTETDFEIASTKSDLAEAALKLANIQMDEVTVVAPFDGVVAEVYVSEGSAVGTSTPIALFVSKDVQVVLNVEEGRVGQFDEGQSAAMELSAFPGQEFPGVVTSVAPVADAASHTFAVEVTPIDEDQVLRSGMYVDLKLLVERDQDALLVPVSAVVDSGDQQIVYVVDQDVVSRRSVETGVKRGNDWIEIQSGIAVGEQVVVAGHTKLEDGSHVEVVTQDAE